MVLESLHVSGLRNIDRIDLVADHKCNWIWGPNGAGKTSLLEAIFLLARGRSFRGKKHGSVLGREKQYLEVGAKIFFDTDTERTRSIGLRRSKKEIRYFEDGHVAHSLQDLRDRLHVRIIADNAQRLLEGDPKTRRLFLDWNLFHVEHGYARTLSEFRRVLNQRNAWLRAGARGPAVWDTPYVRLATTIAEARGKFVADLHESFRIFADRSDNIPAVEQIVFRRGWPETYNLDELLRLNLNADLARGFTYYGPPRADFSLRCHPAGGLPSRGQTKLLVFYLQLGAQLFSDRKHGPQSIWLLDDLSSDLDSSAYSAVTREIRSIDNQVFITAIGDRSVPPSVTEFFPGRMFHVEHGSIVT